MTSVNKNNFGINITKIFSNIATTDGSPLTGAVSLQFYASLSTSPVGFYGGKMKDGLADGYGVFIKPYFVDSKTDINLKAELTIKTITANTVYFEDGMVWERL